MTVDENPKGVKLQAMVEVYQVLCQREEMGHSSK